MSWYVNVTGTPAAVRTAVANDTNTPQPLKECIAAFTDYFNQGESVTVETQGHFDTAANPPTGNATLVFKVTKFAREAEMPPKPLDATAAVVGTS